MSLGAELVGREYDVTLAYTVEYRLSVTAGPTDDAAIQEADLLAKHGAGVAPFDRDLVHTEVDATRPIYADDPEAFEVADWIDAPSAPSEDTYYDDTRHFDAEADSE